MSQKTFRAGNTQPKCIGGEPTDVPVDHVNACHIRRSTVTVLPIRSDTMLVQDAEESGPTVLTTLRSMGIEEIDLARGLGIMQELDNRIVSSAGQRMRGAIQCKFM